MAVTRVELSKGGLEVSRLICGTWRMKDDPRGFAPARVLSRVDACLEEGITTFDLADIYGGYECEAIFGRALRERAGLREKIEIVTKCDILAPCPARPGMTVKHYNATAEYIISNVERALTDLGTDHIDLLLVHRPDFLTRAEDTARGLDKLVSSGKARHVGVSNYSTAAVALLESVMKAPVSTNQIEVSLFRMDAMFDGTLAQSEQCGARPMAWSPTGGGRLFNAGDEVAERIRKAADAMSSRYGGASVDQIATAWILSLPSQPVVVLGTNQPERIRAAAKADGLSLSREDWYALWEAAQGREVP